MKHRTLFAGALVAVAICGTAGAQTPILVDPSNGKYLGNLSTNRFDPNSVANPFGQYGSKFSPDSINNKFGEYGSPYSVKSARNPYATSAPVIVDPQGQ